jgi:hypothetical protein
VHHGNQMDIRTMKIEQLLQFSENSKSVQSTVTNNKTIQQTVIHLIPMMHNPRLTLCHTQIFSPLLQYLRDYGVLTLLNHTHWTFLSHFQFYVFHWDSSSLLYRLWCFLVCMLSLSLLTMSSVDKKIDHIFVRNTFLFACDKRRRFRSISVPEEMYLISD